MRLRPRTERHDRGAGTRLTPRLVVDYSVHRFFAAAFSRMVLFHPEARAISRTETRLARADSGNRILRPFHIRLRTDKLRPHPAGCRKRLSLPHLALRRRRKAAPKSRKSARHR